MLRWAPLLAVVLLAGCASGGSVPAAPISPPPQTWTVTNGTLTLMASAGFGGAIVSLTDAAGNQYVNTSDHGREFQTAYTLDGLAEVENPTEAGSFADASGQVSTSIIKGMAASGAVLSSTVNPAYWEPYNGALVSPDTISKTITLGYGGIANVIRWDVTIVLAQPHTLSTFEGLTGYGPPLPELWVQQPSGSWMQSTPAPNVAVQYGSPIIEASADGAQAIGVYTPLTTPLPYQNAFNTQLAGVDKWDCAWWNTGTYPGNAIPAGTYSATCYVAVGTLAQVEASITILQTL